MDTAKIRKDFPILEKPAGGKPLIYMDSACMSLKPFQVTEAMMRYYNEFPACAGRSVHRMGRQLEEARARSREAMKKFIGAKKAEELIFTRNTTEGLNLVISSLGLKKGDAILTTDREHNSNLVPCQMLKERLGVSHRVVRSRKDETFDMDAFISMLKPDVRLVSFVHTSNIDGYTLPVKEIIKAAHDNSSLVCLDAAQAVPHTEVDCRRLGADFLAFSGHKMLGPTGTGVLYVKHENYERMHEFMVGGETVEWTTYESHKFLKPPERFEAGLQNYAGEIGMAAAAEYISRVGKGNIEKHEKAMTARMHEGLSAINGIRIAGVQKPEMRGGITSFTVDGIGFHHAAMLLDRNFGIAVRSGQHCAHSWFKDRGIEGTVRASLYLYNTMEEVDAFIEAMGKIIKLR